MSTFDSDDLDTKGYFLPEDSQLRLKQLREYVRFLTNLARPRRPDEDREGYAEIRPGEVAICMELLEEQIAQVLDELSWPAERGETAPAPEARVERDAGPKAAAVTAAADTDDSEPAFGGSAMNEAGERYVSGVTLDQIDELARLGDILRAHGDVVTATDQADFADVTLSIMGDAIIRDAERLRDIIHDVDSVQRLDGRRRSHADVKEEAAIYLAADDLVAIDAAFTAPKAGFSRLLALTPDQRQTLTKMGDKSEAFCRKADAVSGENLAILPANFDLAAYRRDLATLDALRPRLARLSKLSQRGDDTQMAVGSDLMTNALEGYAVLKVTGKGQGVDDLRKMLANRFARGPRSPSTPDAPPGPTLN